ncbi:MAG: sigma-54-dependent Fis family transcriptional regulator [Bacteroidetes bacterium]|nr:sigma-54-dependent Fis family transcriptional regulator [Bacteroidota bacterium]
MPHLLAIDDDLRFLTSLRNLVSRLGYTMTIENNPHLLEDHLRKQETDCVLLDVKMPGRSGIDVLRSVKSGWPAVPVIMISGESTITIALDCIKQGAFDFIEKPIDPDRLLIALRNATESKSLNVNQTTFLTEIKKEYEILGTSHAIVSLHDFIGTVAPTDARVLIYGETGTGKELIARSIHLNSKRVNKPFIKLNCASIPSELLESELFGFRKGSFTGASRDQRGKFLLADQGTLFLDEIGDMSMDLQAKLLRVLEEGEVDLIGDPTPRKINVRVIAATNQDLPQRIRNHQFREDLYHRLHVVSTTAPALRDRPEDIGFLANTFIRKFCDQYNKPILTLADSAIHEMAAYSWPGNVRELKNLMERLVIFTKTSIVSDKEVKSAMGLPQSEKEHHPSDSVLKSTRDDSEKQQIVATLEYHHWAIGETADALGINRTTLFKKMKRYAITKP